MGFQTREHLKGQNQKNGLFQPEVKLSGTSGERVKKIKSNKQ